MSNAQAAIIAAATGANWSATQAIERAEKFKKWLDEQDDRDRAALTGRVPMSTRG
jgi:hypothetical protein